MDAILSKFDLYPLENPTSYCIGFTLNDQYVDTIIDMELGIEDEDYYINKAYDKLKIVLKNMACKQNLIGRKIPVPVSNPEPINKKEENIVRKKPNTLFNKVKVAAPETNCSDEKIFASSHLKSNISNCSDEKIFASSHLKSNISNCSDENNTNVVIPSFNPPVQKLKILEPVLMPIQNNNSSNHNSSNHNSADKKTVNDILFRKIKVIEPTPMPNNDPIPDKQENLSNNVNVINTPERKVLNEIFFGKQKVQESVPMPNNERVIENNSSNNINIPETTERKVLNDILFGKIPVLMPTNEPAPEITERKNLNDILFGKVKIIEPVQMPENTNISNSDKKFTENSVVIKDTSERKNLNDILFEKIRKIESINNKVDDKLSNILLKIRKGK
jgi:hypothetical protein